MKKKFDKKLKEQFSNTYKLGILIDIDMLLMEEKCIRGGICLAIYKDLLFSQNFPANNFE